MPERIRSLALDGIEGYAVTVECDIAGGLPSFDVVGLPDAAVRESRERVRAAMKNCGCVFPARRITVNLAPAGGRARQARSTTCPSCSQFYSRRARARRTAGGRRVPRRALALRRTAARRGRSAHGNRRAGHGDTLVLLPGRERPRGARFARGLDVYPVETLDALLDHLAGRASLAPVAPWEQEPSPASGPDYADVMGQEQAKRALEIAAAGGHNILLIGPPGAGKSMLTERLPSILPSMTPEEALEATKIHSVAGLTSAERPMLSARPFRARRTIRCPPRD